MIIWLKEGCKDIIAMSNCDIVMPVWNKKGLTQQCIESIFKNTNCQYRIIIIDNASNLPAREYLEKLQASRPDKVSLIRNEQNSGFTKAVNQGIKNSSADYVCIVNNDIIVFDGWLDEMISVAEANPDIGIVNPSNNFGRKKPWNKSYQQYALDRTAGRQGEFVQTAAPVGFCYLIKREVINKIGLWDERFNPGYFEDTEYAIRAQKAGYKSVFANGAFVFHFEHSSFKKRGFNKLFKQSEEKFYSTHKRPQRILYALSKAKTTYYSRIIGESYNFAKNGDWVSVFLKKSAPEISLPGHTYIRAFRFSGLFFNIAVILKVLFKKKKFSKIFVDDEGLADRLKRIKKHHKAEVELLV